MSKGTITPVSDSIVVQEQLLPFLLNPESYPHRPQQVRLVQTHSSFVFLASPFVYKIKKPVNFGFLNFSTLEKRRHFCEREVTLNRRLSPKVYLGVVPISMQKDHFTFGEGDQVVEYAVKMRRLSAGHFLNQRVDRNLVGPTELNRLASVLQQFYRAQQPTTEIESWGRIDRLRISTDENFRQVAEFIGRTLSRPAFEAIRQFTNQFYARQRSLFAARRRQHWIRDCHGDLHLDHIHSTPRELNIYDCIEFNDRFRYVDVANDVAFLAMDLDYQGRPDLARYFTHRIASLLQDEGLGRLLDFYKCYRAFVRGKVESLHSLAHAAPEAERHASAGRARRYFRLALNYTVAGSTPMVLAVMGRIASGKSTLAQALGDELGWEVYSSDYVRKKMAGFPLYERSSAAARTRLYSARMTERTYQRLLTTAEAQLKKGHCVILDATFARREHRQLLVNRFTKRGLAWRFLEAQASNTAMKQRLRVRETQPEEISDARFEDFGALTQLYEPPNELTDPQCLRVRTAGSLDQAVIRALHRLGRIQVDAPGRSALPPGR